MADVSSLGQEQLSLWHAGLERAMQYRMGNDREEQFFDVLYSDLVKDPIAVAHSIYEHFGMPLGDDTERLMKTFMAQNKEGKHGKHRYSLEEFGLSKAKVHKVFSDYLDAYKVATS